MLFILSINISPKYSPAFLHIPHIFIQGGCCIPKLLVYISIANNNLVCTPEGGRAECSVTCLEGKGAGRAECSVTQICYEEEFQKCACILLILCFTYSSLHGQYAIWSMQSSLSMLCYKHDTWNRVAWWIKKVVPLSSQIYNFSPMTIKSENIL